MVTRQWRLARASALAAPLLWPPPPCLPAMSQQFFTSVMWHLPGKVAFDGGFATSGNHSAQGILAAIGAWTGPADAVLAARRIGAVGGTHLPPYGRELQGG